MNCNLYGRAVLTFYNCSVMFRGNGVFIAVMQFVNYTTTYGKPELCKTC